MIQNQLNKLFWVFWFIFTIYVGILCGFMLSHVLIFGRYASWTVETGNSFSSFVAFRNSSEYPLYYGIYNSFLYISLIIGIIFSVLTFLAKRDRIEKIFSIIVGLSSLWVGMIFIISDLDEAEAAVMSGTADPSMAQFYALINIPLHTLFAFIYIPSFILLLIIALKNIEFKSKPSKEKEIKKLEPLKHL